MIDSEGLSVRAWAIARGIDVRLLDRAAKGEHAITVDTLDTIAVACGLKPWHLLVDGVDLETPPDSVVSKDDRELLIRLRAFLSK